MTLNLSLDGRVAVVTGASSGIGAEIATMMAVAGADVVLVGRNASRLSETERRVLAAGAEALTVAVDLDDPDAPRRIASDAVRGMGRIDILVNCAGIFIPASVDHEETVEYFERQWRTNVHAPFALTVAVLPELRRREGSVIFLSSVAGRVGYTNATAYCATKGAIETLVKALAVEEAPNGVRVNAITPGNVETPMNAGERANLEFLHTTIDATPAGRYALPQEIAPMAVFLASDLAGFITGESVVIDGGWIAK